MFWNKKRGKLADAAYVEVKTLKDVVHALEQDLETRFRAIKKDNEGLKDELRSIKYECNLLKDHFNLHSHLDEWCQYGLVYEYILSGGYDWMHTLLKDGEVICETESVDLLIKEWQKIKKGLDLCKKNHKKGE